MEKEERRPQVLGINLSSLVKKKWKVDLKFTHFFQQKKNTKISQSNLD